MLFLVRQGANKRLAAAMDIPGMMRRSIFLDSVHWLAPPATNFPMGDTGIRSGVPVDRLYPLDRVLVNLLLRSPFLLERQVIGTRADLGRQFVISHLGFCVCLSHTSTGKQWKRVLPVFSGCATFVSTADADIKGRTRG